MFFQKVSNLFRSRKFWALILSFITLVSALVLGEINFWQFMQAALVALAVFSTGIAIEDMTKGWRSPGEQHIYDLVLYSIPEQFRMILLSRKFWVLLVAVLTATGGFLTGDLTIWQFVQTVVGCPFRVFFDGSHRRRRKNQFEPRRFEHGQGFDQKECLI